MPPARSPSEQFLQDDTLLQTTEVGTMRADWVELADVHLLLNDHLFIFANNKAMAYDHKSDQIAMEYRPEHGHPVHGSCGLIVATSPNLVWEIEDMSFGWIMGDMVMLPDTPAPRPAPVQEPLTLFRFFS